MNNGWEQLRRILSYHFPCGSVFGIRLEVHWAVLLVPLYVAGERVLGASLGFALAFTVVLFGMILLHELGHIFMAKRFHIPSDKISLSPLGGLAHTQQPGANPTQDILISLAGPATHLPWLMGFGLARAIWGPGFLQFGGIPLDWMLWYVNLSLFLFNMLPFYPMDMGRVLQGVLSYRLDRGKALLIAANVGLVGAVAFMVGGLAFGWTILILIGLSNLFACLQARSVARYGGQIYGEPREAWQADPEAWKQGQSVFGDTDDKKSGFLGRRKVERDRKAHNRKIQEQEDLDQELDRVLEKIHNEGMSSLTRAERKLLKKVSDQRQKK